MARQDPWRDHRRGIPRNPLGWRPWARVRVRGPSMVPTLYDADIVLVRRTNRARPGEIALVRWPSRPDQLSVKRLLRRDDFGWHALGDNVFGSADSRELGPAVVLGVIHWRLWPRPGRLPALSPLPPLPDEWSPDSPPDPGPGQPPEDSPRSR